MTLPVSDLDAFRARLAGPGDKSVIFGFLLYDSRPSQQVVGAFAQDQAAWIDELARGAGVQFFVPVRKVGSELRNPSPEIVRLFGLGVSRLPGILLFEPPSADGRIKKKHAVYIPLEKRDFNDPAVYEPILTDLFDLIRDSLEQHRSGQKALQQIRERLVRLRRKRTRRGFAAYIRKGAHLILVDIPKAVYAPFAEGLGKALGEKAAGK